MRDTLGWPETQEGRIFKNKYEVDARPQACNPEWEIGAALTVVIINSN